MNPPCRRRRHALADSDISDLPIEEFARQANLDPLEVARAHFPGSEEECPVCGACPNVRCCEFGRDR
jgi:hypothetical protein